MAIYSRWFFADRPLSKDGQNAIRVLSPATKKLMFGPKLGIISISSRPCRAEAEAKAGAVFKVAPRSQSLLFPIFFCPPRSGMINRRFVVGLSIKKSGETIPIINYGSATKAEQQRGQARSSKVLQPRANKTFWYLTLASRDKIWSNFLEWERKKTLLGTEQTFL